MTRDILEKALDRLTGVERGGEGYSLTEGHHLSFYIGQPGQAMVIREVARVELTEDFVILTQSGAKGTLIAEYDGVHAVGTVPSKDARDRRAGF